MPKSMVIVESPAKARTIGKYLGKDFIVKASAGHVKDLPDRALGVDIRNGFRPTYRVIRGKEKVLKGLKKDAEKVDSIYLAADPDREGEAICSHLEEELRGGGERKILRVLFNEITKPAILKAFENPTRIDRNKVEAQQARRIVDRLVGYKVSPLLWQKLKKGLSAGRVQTVALRLIVEREREILAFVPEEYWVFGARLEGMNPPPFEAKAVKRGGEKFRISNQQEADQLLDELKETEFVVAEIEKKERKRNPLPPFTTSKLQQDAVRRLGFTVKKAMSVAQKLYEGVEIGAEGAVGLITYMRTDSTRVAESALEEARHYIGQRIGSHYLPAKPVRYSSKAGAQDAHEAIRPTAVAREPELLRPYLSKDEYRLYTLIWQRFVASQMRPALFDQTEIVVAAGETEFKATGSIMKFDGYLRAYREEEDSVAAEEASGEGTILPKLEIGEKLKVLELLREQKFTQPPPRFNEASLVKTLEEKGIGRPSTYQQILSVILTRDYVTKHEGRFSPSELGETVIDLLLEHFEGLFNYNYTAQMETDLDSIEDGKKDAVAALEDFYQDFKQKLEAARGTMRNLRREGVPTGENCPECGAAMVMRWGRYGKFISCKNYPECRTTRKIENDGTAGSPGVRSMAGEKCPECGAELVVRRGKYGEFIACSNYPSCKFIKKESTGVSCPSCGKGAIVVKRSRRGKVFYGCDRYPECKFVTWEKPVPEPCPSCDAPYLFEKSSKKAGVRRYCKKCGAQVSEVLTTHGQAV